ncbi:YbjN domain-containing protein [Klebsiella pneumoniae]|uniref:YbjN domain-containing protein n=2 Tax=Klebsiella pneumoniae TaxID=573 RepID=UPI00188911EB|nr:YbjN domain-containing protein [Klebsiella pneumoniae]MBF2808679.1 YbjN domain-containing protein [Klebsiella pneumoniae]QPP67492.1 YbjN domain-containing protein [Klebsiella pneumoniae]
MSEHDMIESVNPPLLTEVLQSAGYRTNETELNGVTQLLSASQGVRFSLRFGNPGQTPGEYLDFTLSTALRIEGSLPAELVAQWNHSRRFSRLTEQGGFLVLETDVVVAGGVSRGYLQATLELWDRLLQEFLLYLRNAIQTVNEKTPATVEEPAAAQPPTLSSELAS